MPSETEVPGHQNGQVLRRLAECGVDLTASREVEFAHRAPDQSAAEAFAKAATGLGYSVAVKQPDAESVQEGDTDWDVICKSEMVPTEQGITDIETRLTAVAREHGCREDGWGFLD